MEIKWHDMSGGAVTNERWQAIPEAKAKEMLRRRFPDTYYALCQRLDNGDEIVTEAYSVRDEKKMAEQQEKRATHAGSYDWDDEATYWPGHSYRAYGFRQGGRGMTYNNSEYRTPADWVPRLEALNKLLQEAGAGLEHAPQVQTQVITEGIAALLCSLLFKP